MGDFNVPILPSLFAPFSANVKENGNTRAEEFLSRADFKPVNTLFRKHRSQLLSFYGPSILFYILLRPKKWITSVTDFVTITPLAIASDHNLLKMKLKWKLKNNVMGPTKVKYSYANLRRLPQFSDDAITAVNHLLVTNHILQNYTLEPALGLQNYSLFSAAVKNSIEFVNPSLRSG